MQRCNEPELLESENLSPDTVAETYRQLQTIHRWLGNTDAVLRCLRNHRKIFKRPLRRVLDIGCGQGAVLIEIRDRLQVDVIGLDLRPAPGHTPVTILTGNAAIDLLPSADTAISMMLAHHLDEAELVALIRNVSRSCDRLVLLDLVRHPLPLALFRLFAVPFLSRINALDGQTSIRRAYTRNEMRSIVGRALAASGRPVKRFRQTVSPLWIRQVVDIAWEPSQSSQP